ncbi:hypothetical protein HK100_012238 [Physocladia obscura]|uniref:GH18 domain-containing protein n=1 Tax=Physocladia obscura TaxID=109957 RepID=A0AAD5T1T1_9FUNG|nr:hypothetical protein HK100_012238 [Physocladia obscura]
MNSDDDNPFQSGWASRTEVPVTRTDVSLEEIDLQGIRWADFAPTTRASFRDQRIVSYRNYRNCSTDHSAILNDLHRPRTDACFFDFAYTLTKHKYKCSEYHFQLRNLLWSTTKHSVFYSHVESVRNWSSLSRTSCQILKRDGFRVSTICANNSFVFMGAFTGEYLFRVSAITQELMATDANISGNGNDDNDPSIHYGIITNDRFGITNHVELGCNRSGQNIAVISSNDDSLRLLNLDSLVISHHFRFPWAVNCSSMSPDKRLICVTGDNTDSSIITADSGDEVIGLKGHIDFSFSCAWSPCGRFIATGNQDITTRIYDIRNPSKALVVLPAVMGAVRSLRFSDDGTFLAAAEPCDFVHIYDVAGTTNYYKQHETISAPLPSNNNDKIQNSSGFIASPLGIDAFQSQVIEFFGEIAGISFTPDGGDLLYIGISDDRTTTKKSSKLYGYYGQNALANGVDIKNGTNSRVTVTSDYQRSLAYYCQTGFYDVINLAFLNIFGGGKNTFTITFASFNVTTAYGGHYTYNGDGLESNSADVVQGYASIGLDIITCQALGVKVILSIGGDRVSPYTFVVGDGAAYATLFYDMFLDGKSAVRPFGEGVVLNGIEMDVEKNDDPTVWTPEMISFLQNLKKLSPNSLVAVVPQCYLGSAGKDENVGDVIAAAASSIDYLIIQYYNNPVCSYPFGFNFVTWKTLFTGPLVIGLAGDWTSAISGGFLDASALQTVYDLVKSDDQFAGFSVYDVSSSNPPAFAWSFVDYADPPLSEYSQTLRNVLDGKGSGGVSLASLGPAPLENTATAYRCGGTWVDANSTCSNAVCSDTSSTNCGANQNCFQNLSPVC